MCMRVLSSSAILQVRNASRLIRTALVFQFVRALLAVTMLIGLAACTSPTAPPISALTPVTVQLSWTHQAEFAGLYAADQLGYFAAEGLQVSFVEGGRKWISSRRWWTALPSSASRSQPM